MLKIEGGGEWLSAPATLPEVGIKPVEEKKRCRLCVYGQIWEICLYRIIKKTTLFFYAI